MKPDYKNWMPKGMIYSFLFAALGCGIAAACFRLLPDSTLIDMSGKAPKDAAKEIRAALLG